MSIGSLLIISGPSGSGKGTVVKALAKSGDNYAVSVSVTTRKIRRGEREGVDYFFKTEDEFGAMRDNEQLLEHASFVGNLYGTPRFYVEDMIEKGKTVLLEIEVNGALQVRERYPDCVLIFLVPPSFDELQRRLAARGTEDKMTAQSRIVRAKEEIALIGKYDYLVINDQVEKAVDCIQKITFAEGLRPARNKKFLEVY